MPGAQGNDEWSEWLGATENQQLYDCKHWLLLALLLQTAKAVATAARALSLRVCVTRQASAPKLGLVSQAYTYLHAIKDPIKILSRCHHPTTCSLCCFVAHCFSSRSPLAPCPVLSYQNDYIRKKNKWLKPIFDWVAAHGNEPIIPFSGAYESEVGGTR
jgi:hypothetical protein